MSSKLQIFNDALILCGENPLSALTDDIEGRYLLDQVYANSGIDACLEQGNWFFAMRATRFDYDTTITPDFGYQRAFQKPDDWIATIALSADEYFTMPLSAYSDEAGYWYADLDELYVRYVSNDSSYGGDLSLWPDSFHDFVAGHFARKIVFKLTGDKERILLVEKAESRRLLRAKSANAKAGPVRFPPEGSWNRSRRGSSNRDRGNRGSLIG